MVGQEVRCESPSLSSHLSICLELTEGDTISTTTSRADWGENRVPGDSVVVNGVGFKRDYWAVYAGQGQWETVINCYAYHDGQYYVVSLGHDSMAGKPGEFVNGSRTTKQQMRTGLINSLQDTTNDYVRSFNQILSSFSLTK